MTDPRLTIDSKLFATLIGELADRGQGRRESGAFLLGRREHDGRLPVPVVAVAYYDDLDPESLTGGITFHGSGYTALNARCRRDQLRVVGDIHTHPGLGVQQSHMDSTHPMIAREGHVAMIAPVFAHKVGSAADLGVHVRVDGGWETFVGAAAAAVVRVHGDRRRRPVEWWRALLSSAGHWIRLWRTR